jgi:membrane associated rhomboid family serine protease
MLIIPLSGTFSWRNLPVITIFIIIINCVVFFTLQSGDQAHHQKATEFYLSSGLARIEVSRYIRFTEGETEDRQIVNKEELARWFLKMQRDDAFLTKLLTDKIITPQDTQYEPWKKLRTTYDSLLEKVSYMKYGFIPARHTVLTVFSHMFLHGSFMHLLGNMIYLWLVGCVLEVGFGRVSYIVLYLLGGVIAVETFFLFRMHSLIPLIGASGAIAGLMGAYTVAYGRKKINIFYSLGFYFNYTRVAGIILLPLWLINEFFQLIYFSTSNVAYMAHIGGLVGGSFLGFLQVKVFKKVDQEVFEEDPKEQISPLMEKAMDRIQNLDMAEARRLLLEILAIDENNMAALNQLFHIDKLQPESENFHKTASKLIMLLSRVRGTEERLYKTYSEYSSLVEKPRLNADLLLRLSFIFSTSVHIDESEKIIDHVLRNFGTHPQVPLALLNVATENEKRGRHDRSVYFLQILRKRYPQSQQAVTAERMLNRSKVPLSD